MRPRRRKEVVGFRGLGPHKTPLPIFHSFHLFRHHAAAAARAAQGKKKKKKKKKRKASCRMQAVRTLVLRHLRLACRRAPPSAAACGGARPAVYGVVGVAPGHRGMAASAGQEGGPPRDFSEGAVRARVVELVKKFDRIDADKVTETADFQRDLSLDSLDRVELVMAFEQEFSVEIPDDKADKLSCCADVAKYIISESQSNKGNAGSS
uniref:Acyl carrier protein n=1 Tax=Oryza rufipogon TaxID=4529 RepID=A0A0E0NXU9_ORYRU